MMETPTYADAPPGWFRAMTRLWLLRRVESPPSGNPMRASAAMGGAWLLLWIALDRWLSQPDPQFYAAGIPLLAWYGISILALAAVLRWRAAPAPAPEFGPVLALALGAVPVPLLFAAVAADYLDTSWFWAGAILVGIYTLLYLARGLRAVTGETQRAAACAGLLFVLGVVWATDRLDVIPDVWAPGEPRAEQAGESPVDGESLLFEQAARIDRALAAIHRGSATTPKAFFLGFAGVGDQKVFAQEIGLASRVLGERYDIDGRSLSLINDQRDLDRAPLATVSGLKYALQGLAARMNLDEDVLFLSISSHGSQDPSIAVSNSELPLDNLGDEDLAEALRDSGIKWRVIIISACYAGGFIESLQDPRTIVIAAAAADRTSFGCSNDRDLTYFGEAFYRDALPAAGSLREAFDAAKTAIAKREHLERVDPSNPQAFFGAKMQAKLAAMSAGAGEK